MILLNRFRPGNKLVLQELALLLNVSRTPVREALERLYQEGFVIRIPRRGFFVSEIDVEEAQELYEVRQALESYALRTSLANGISGKDLWELERFTQAYGNLVQRELSRERMLLDRDFHLFLAGLAGNRYLVRSLEAVFERLILKRRVEGYGVASGWKAYHEHEILLDAIRREDAGKAVETLSLHIDQAWQRLLGHLDDLGGT
jgi:DNA-binding GntR family transcriptional regulator